MIHREYAGTNEVFKKACELAHVGPTVRQASKFRRGIGIAFGFRKAAIETLEVKSNQEKSDGKE